MENIQTDTTFSKFLVALEHQATSLKNLRTLKLRQTSLSDSSIRAVVALCPMLERVDLSFTLVVHPLWLSVPLQKLSLTSTLVSNIDLLATIANLPQLRILYLGALGERQGSSATMGNSTALTFNNDTLMRLTDILQNFMHLESVSLVGNTKLCLTERHDGAMSNFISRVGRKCKVRFATNTSEINLIHRSSL